MSDGRAMPATLPIAHRYEHDREHDWAPLERFANLATRSGHTLCADDFMWMGAAEFADGRSVHSYKHIDTRRYLHLDEAGHAYQYKPRANGGHYVTHSEPGRAIEALAVGTSTRSL